MLDEFGMVAGEYLQPICDRSHLALLHSPGGFGGRQVEALITDYASACGLCFHTLPDFIEKVRKGGMAVWDSPDRWRTCVQGVSRIARRGTGVASSDEHGKQSFTFEMQCMTMW